MKEFMSMRDFLMLVDPYDHAVPKRSIFHVYQGSQEWVRLYEIAKHSYDMYGDNGPPVGSQVVTLESGHGGGAGLVRILDGIEEGDPRFFLLSRTERNHKYMSLASRVHWWAHFRPYDDSYVIMRMRSYYWHGEQGWVDNWLTAARYTSKDVADVCREGIKSDGHSHVRVVHAEGW